MKEVFENFTGFEWDEGNAQKNWICHQVTQGECEQVFFNEPIVVFQDSKHSIDEKRWYLLGKTDTERQLFLFFSMRGKLIRIISARDMNKKEKEACNEQE